MKRYDEHITKYVANIKKYVENMKEYVGTWWPPITPLHKVTFGGMFVGLGKFPRFPPTSSYFLNSLSLRACTGGGGESP